MNERYTHGFHERVVSAHARRTAEDCAAFLIPRLSDQVELLDVGCGPGSITVGLADHCARVVGVDTEPSVITEAEELVRARGLDNVTFEVGSAYELRWPDASFDVVYAHQLLQHLGDPLGALREFRRVLRPGGLVAVRDSDYATMVHSPIEPMIERWRDLYHEVTRANGGEPDAGRHLYPWVIEAGFVEVQASARPWVFADAESCAWWSELWAVRITEGTFADHAVEFGMAGRAELDEMAAAFRRWGARPDAFWALLHGQVLGTRA